ncbi:hypothetical protein DH2020_001483 [Rehmannia glutinosa]|uniref:RNase H type-1 domain-containing protein n=1 Tax=Rehmannia glutinosa TaxID=99300 RepID=A0ABR0XZS8_REHGL
MVEFCKSCWRAAGMYELVDEWAEKSESMQDFVEAGISHGESWVAAKFCTILWCLWRQRNCEVWENKHLSAAGTIVLALHVLNDWCKSRGEWLSNETENSDVQGQFWRKPIFPFMKCNVDAALNHNSNYTGIGMILRDDQGDFVVARTMWFPGLFTVREAEAMGVREALSWIHGLGIRHVEVETDAKYVIDDLSSPVSGRSEYDCILQECQSLLLGEPEVSVGFVRRSANMVAHELAK